MRILFDQAAPVPLRPHLKGHLVRTAAQEGWDRLRNGDLLGAAEKAGFDLLITTDKNMVHQQNLTGRKIAIITLSRQQWPKPLARSARNRGVECGHARQLHRSRYPQRLNPEPWASAFLRFAEAGDDGEVLEGGGIAFDFAVSGQLSKQAAHDLAAAGLGQSVGEADVVWAGQRADLL